MVKPVQDCGPGKLFGLMVRKERWGLSWRGRIVAILLILVVGIWWILSIHSFLAVTRPVDTRILVVEGWVSNYGLKGAINEYHSGHYQYVFATGGPMSGMGASSSIYDTDAYRTAELLRKAGIPDTVVHCVPCPFIGRNRTYNSALTLKNWFRDHNMTVQSFNVLTEDAHARRTWMLFKEAFGKDVQIGIISVPDPDYDAKHWWRSSEGVRGVIDETIAYVYARFFFWPGKSGVQN
jgi:hypothetical protein